MCSALASIDLPEGIGSIENAAFSGCKALASITCLSKTPQPSTCDTIFDDYIYKRVTLFVPKEAVEAYKMAIGWRRFKKIVAL